MFPLFRCSLFRSPLYQISECQFSDTFSTQVSKNKNGWNSRKLTKKSCVLKVWPKRPWWPSGQCSSLAIFKDSHPTPTQVRNISMIVKSVTLIMLSKQLKVPNSLFYAVYRQQKCRFCTINSRYFGGWANSSYKNFLRWHVSKN